MPSTHFLPIFVLCPHFCNWAHCHLVEIFTSWMWIGLVTVRTHLESRLGGSMGRVVSLCSISPSACSCYFCLHRWCTASSVSLVRRCSPCPSPPLLPDPPPSHHYQLETGNRGPLAHATGEEGEENPWIFIKSIIFCVSKLGFSSTGFGWEQYLCLIWQQAASNMQGTE